ncbi:uncharacterized protein Eint_020860 [Encephalitozoon intestinalis ATCC 50506]|uniref:Uncharacterized protein n=1 Tax=Encephalitozoon intestinalis (strain ATCC 50506) TaxID=876142 RepID=E0S5U9_ENCIT|nr:uncharacterized protein Eint_020860 [Encephalitozoon intestinalis ATCC 50506]ADM11084.1 hypothetical protein Eint_020860 [Encephalitozoon intestinalis ATCC 50506]UTX44738.1 hypothetical protein GPK93_02g02560 [Encephalitozoon intestinalis]
MKRNYIQELSTKHLVCDYERIKREYLRYKAKNIDTLEYVDDAMLAVYEHAFFFNFTKTKFSKKDLPKEVKPRILKAALEEVKKKYVPNKSTEEKGLVCNLYSITNTLSFQ